MFKKITAIFFILIFCLLIIPQNVIAHSPANMSLDYDFGNQKLNVTISHSVGDPNSHYIENVKVWRNDNLIIDQDYTSQPSTSSFTYTYPVTAVDGDVLKVTATCSISGDVTRQITADEPVMPNIMVSLEPTISNLNENGTADFTITITSNSAPLDGAVVSIFSDHGTISNEEPKTGGKYDFTYTAPEVEVDENVIISIEVAKDGFNNGTIELKFMVLDTSKDIQKEPTFDGVISDEEYDFSAEFSSGDLKIHWKLSGDTIIFGLEAKTTGWISLGIEPVSKMKDADMIFGWVSSSGDTKIVDAYSTGEFGPHPRDTDQGGKDNVLEFGGKEASGWTIIEFSRLLKTGDPKDKDLITDGDIKIIWAIGQSDNFESSHSKRGSGTINLGTGETTEDEYPTLWPIHAIFMIFGFLMLLTGILIARVMKKKNWWMKAHKTLNSIASISGILGIIIGLYMVQTSDGMHFKYIHGYLGLITVILLILNPVLGFSMFKVKEKVKRIKLAHRIIGWLALIFMLITILMGLILVQLI